MSEAEALEAALWAWRGLLLRRYPIVRSPGHYYHVVMWRHGAQPIGVK